MRAPLAEARAKAPLPEVHLSSEHFFDEVVLARIRAGQACPYPVFDPKAKKRAILVELASERFAYNVHGRFFDVHRAGFYPVLAHPERYAPVWASTDALAPITDAGVHLLLDVCALVGKYGRAAQRAAEKLLDDGAYEAACSDAHKPEDLDAVGKAIVRLEKLVGADGARDLLDHGPRRILGMPVADEG
jgi:protein-tyrosine phosphatase